MWVHRDVTGSNLLLRGDRLCGVIDFGCTAVTGWVAWARGWALWKALIDIPGRPIDDPGRTGARFGWRWDAFGVIDQVIADSQ